VSSKYLAVSLTVCLKTHPVAVESLKYWLVLSGKTGPCCCCAGIGCGCGLDAVRVLLVVGFWWECCIDTDALCSLSRKMQVIKSDEVLRSTRGTAQVLWFWESTFGCLVHLCGLRNPR
jgi:hypothetical protein